MSQHKASTKIFIKLYIPFCFYFQKFNMNKYVVRILVFSCLISLVQPQFIPPLEPEKDGDPLKPLCEANAEMPDDLIQCGSCNSRCGFTSNPDSLQFPSAGAQCSCDKFCSFHGDCCQDFQQFCPKEFQYSQNASVLYPFTRNFKDFDCETLTTGHRRTVDNLMITTCPDGSECEFTPELNEDVNNFVPMYDIHRGVHYISGYCAVCNGARDVVPWEVKLECNPVPNPKDYIDTGVVNSTESLTDIKETGACDMYYSVTGQARRCYRGNIISTCPSSCQNQELVNLCESGFHAWTVLGGVYRNVYCAVCNNFESATTESLTCGWQGRLPGIFPDGNLRPFGSFSLTLVFDFDPRKGLTVGQHTTPECPTGEVYVLSEDACRPKTCPSGFVLDRSDCIPETSNITTIITGTFSVEPSSQLIDKLYQDIANLETNVKNNVDKILDTFVITQYRLDVIPTFQHRNDSLSTEVNIACNCDFRSLHQDPEGLQRFQMTFRGQIRKEVIGYLLARNIFLTSVNVNLDFQLTSVTFLQTENPECTWLVYQLNETESGNGTMTVISTGKTYTTGMYEVLDEAVIVCETDLGGPGNGIDDVEFALDVVTIICVGISIICLVTRIILQYFIFLFRNTPGKLQLHLTVAFLLAFIMLLVGPFVSNLPDACTTAAILMAYGFLAAFTWMNVIAVDTWLVFRPSSAFSRSDEEQRSLIVHFALGWGISAVLVVLSIGMNYSDVDVNFRPEFGGSRCWYTQRYAMLIYFAVPIAVSILVNICLYVSTSINLHKAFRNTMNVIKAEEYHFGIYVRLFILMGITWMFGFISAFTDQIVIDFVFVILTSLQGLFLFISFVCNKRVLAEVKKKTKSGTSSSSYEKRTKSTPLPSFDSRSKSETKV